MKALLVGYGEIGKGVYEVFSPYHDITVYDPITAPKGVAKDDYDILLVAFGYSDKFVEAVTEYQFEFGIKHTLVFSTTQIGTCSQLCACHCPVEGKHPNLAESIRITSKWLGGQDKTCLDFLSEAEFGVSVAPRPEHTEFLKLRSTTVYGINIEFARYCHEIANELGIDWRTVQQWDMWVNELYREMDMSQFTRYILEPPVGPKGGHCVTPNAKLLNALYPDALVARVAEEAS